MIIDAHAHACGEFANPRKLIDILDKLGVDKVALCPGLKGHTSAPTPPNIPISAIKQHPLYSRYFINPGIRFNYNFLLKEKKENRLKYAIDNLGADHIILGSDTPWDKDSLENNIARIGRLNIDSTEKERILGSNIMDILKL